MYAPSQRLLHGLMAVLLVVTIPLGLVLPHLEEGALAAFLYETHKSIGLTLLGLGLLRLVLRIGLGAPPDPEDVHPVLYRTAKIGHAGLYALLLLVPAVGLTATLACCAPIEFLGLFPFPLQFAASEALTKTLFALHQWAAWFLAVMCVGHVGMALWHRQKGDAVFRRMWPSSRSQSGRAGQA